MELMRKELEKLEMNRYCNSAAFAQLAIDLKVVEAAKDPTQPGEDQGEESKDSHWLYDSAAYYESGDDSIRIGDSDSYPNSEQV
jgi:hypothetical protein